MAWALSPTFSTEPTRMATAAIFSVRFTGLLRIPEAGRRTFYTLSENQSYVVINGKPVAA